ncbi:MAG: hypothetical protein DYG94_08910 [Leptolyngbya sp. PLA3]|nr:MAG: hypothetical protein EDM82_02885 [Cyanobacteria bacterium CYA]MCE7968850.1 hypothetical protein [Leptolyngbya sp. PL-A3]
MSSIDRPSSSPQPRSPRPWIGVRFVCAGAYQRVFRDADGSGYLARCPVCSKCLRFKVAPGGSKERFYEVTCQGGLPARVE